MRNIYFLIAIMLGMSAILTSLPARAGQQSMTVTLDGVRLRLQAPADLCFLEPWQPEEREAMENAAADLPGDATFLAALADCNSIHAGRDGDTTQKTTRKGSFIWLRGQDAPTSRASLPDMAKAGRLTLSRDSTANIKIFDTQDGMAMGTSEAEGKRFDRLLYRVNLVGYSVVRGRAIAIVLEDNSIDPGIVMGKNTAIIRGALARILHDNEPENQKASDNVISP